jgi:hypothetical protein
MASGTQPRRWARKLGRVRPWFSSLRITTMRCESNRLRIGHRHHHDGAQRLVLFPECCLAIRARGHVSELPDVETSMPSAAQSATESRVEYLVPGVIGRRQPMRRTMADREESMELMASA